MQPNPWASQITSEWNAPQRVSLDMIVPPSRGRISDETLKAYVSSAIKRNWPAYRWNSHEGETWIICGGGPSIGDMSVLKELRSIARWTRHRVIALNRTHEFLCKKGIEPWAGVLLDPSDPVKTYMVPRKGVKYFIASQCAPATLDVFEKAEKYIWHAVGTGAECEVMNAHQQLLRVPGDSTVGLRSIMLGYGLGIRNFHLFGFDSSYKDNDPSAMQLHAYAKPETKHKVIPITVPFPDGEKTYWTNQQMARQADEFQKFLWRSFGWVSRGLMEGFNIWVHGSGLLPDLGAYYGLHWRKRKELLNHVRARNELSQGCGRVCISEPSHQSREGRPLYC